MISIEKPEDLISVSLHNIFNYRVNEWEFIRRVKDWNKQVVLYLKPFYPLTIIFQGEEIRFEQKDTPKADLKVTLEFNAMLDIAYGKLNPIMALLTGKLKIKGIFRIKTLLNFMNIFLYTMKVVAEDPTQNYFEMNKSLR